MVMAGFGHRDIGSFSVLMSDPRVTMEPFETWDIGELATQFPLQDTSELAKHVSLVKDIIEKLGSPDKCCGFVVDSDTTRRLEGFTEWHHTDEESVSGLVVHDDLTNTTPQQVTSEFMSLGSLVSMQCNTSRVNRPIDDLEWFYYTARWAAAYNEGASGGKYNGDEIRKFRKMIMNERNDADMMIRGYRHGFWEQKQEGYGPFFVRSVALLHQWSRKLRISFDDWISLREETRGHSDAEKEEYLAYHFLIHAYRGVGEYFEILYQHRALLQEAI